MLEISDYYFLTEAELDILSDGCFLAFVLLIFIVIDFFISWPACYLCIFSFFSLCIKALLFNVLSIRPIVASWDLLWVYRGVSLFDKDSSRILTGTSSTSSTYKPSIGWTAGFNDTLRDWIMELDFFAFGLTTPDTLRVCLRICSEGVTSFNNGSYLDCSTRVS